MFKKLFVVILLSLSALPAIQARAESTLLGTQDPSIVINNRILARANGKAISVVDIMKKMDMLFYKQFPQYTSSPQARFQFYLANWKHVLSETIDKELICADGEESKLQLSAGDIRQEMEQLFGPNIIANLDKVGLTFDEAYQMVKDDITIRRMMYFRVQLKAISQATPQKIREAYEEISKKNIRDNEWIYYVVTIRHRDAAKAANTAHLAYTLLVEDSIPLSELAAKIKEIKPASPKDPTLSISEEFHTNEKELSDAFKNTLMPLEPGTYSHPLSQKSRSDNSTVVRIFYLKDMIPGGVIPFKELESKIKDKLVEEYMEKESIAYLTRLRQHFDIQDSLLQELFSSDFQPFALK